MSAPPPDDRLAFAVADAPTLPLSPRGRTLPPAGLPRAPLPRRGRRGPGSVPRDLDGRAGGVLEPDAGVPTRVVTGARRVAHVALWVTWAAVNVAFWAWWLAPAQRGTFALQLVATVPLAYLVTGLPSFFWSFAGRAARPPERTAPPGMRVALITPCVPSHESLDVVERQLAALGAVRYPHDSWVLDEGDDPAVRALAARHGVRHFSRRGIDRWNTPGPPFQARTKAGNVNAWLDHVAAEGLDYEAFVQLDIDHLPVPEYLDRTLGHLAADPKVAWVQAPSVAGNLDSWTARGLAEQDVVLQGPLQMGFYGHSRTPFIIGSHTTYRTSAIRGIGGYQPTRAEDHLDTVVLAAHGHEGVYVPEIIARGDGPADLATYLGQQFAWAYSMVQILFHHTPRLLRRYSRRQAFQFLAAQSWYLLWSLSCAILWALPIVALVSGLPIADVEVTRFLVAFGAVVAASTLMWWTSRDLFQPAGVTLSWRALLLETARWPVVLAAVVCVLLRVEKPYMITPKGDKADRVVPGRRLYGPYLALAWAGLAAAAGHLALSGAGGAQGYLGLVLLNVLAFLVLLGVAIPLEVRDVRRRAGTRAALRARAGSLVALAVTLLATAAIVAAAWAPVAGAVS